MTNKQEPKWTVDPGLTHWFKAGKPIDNPTRCAVSGADLTPADCGPGVGGAASEPLYEECLAMQGPPEIVVTDEMRRLGGDVLRSCREMEVFNEQAADASYRAMAAVAPREPDMRLAEKTRDGLKNTGSEPLVIYDADHVSGHVVHPGETWTQGNAPQQRADDAVSAYIQKLEAENAKLRADPVELYRADEQRIDALTEQRDAWTAIAARQQVRIATLEAELATMRVATPPTSAQTGVGDKDKPSAAPKPIPASALAPKQSDPRRIGG